jgi:hypothetical protein
MIGTLIFDIVCFPNASDGNLPAIEFPERKRLRTFGFFAAIRGSARPMVAVMSHHDHIGECFY